MIENNLLKTNFLGSDGFRWWIGQVAPKKVWELQFRKRNNAWGNRVKVRIMGYHPQNTVDLPDEDLPWAICLLSPQLGSGKAGKNKALRIQQGDIVVGFFLDGDDAQIPAIFGTIGNSEYVVSGEPGPFAPFSGFTDEINGKDNKRIIENENGADSQNSAPSPRNVDEKTRKKIEETSGKKVTSTSDANGAQTSFAGTPEAEEINNELENAVKESSTADAKKKKKIISDTAKKINSTANGITGSLTRQAFSGLAPKLNAGNEKLYQSVYTKTLAATKSTAIAKKAGTAAQASMIGPVKALQNKIPCVTEQIASTMLPDITSLLTGFLDNVQSFTPCIGEQFTGALFNKITDGIGSALGPELGGVGKILGGFDMVANLKGKAEGLLGLQEAVKCVTNEKTSAEANIWTIGKGPKNIPGVTGGAIMSIANAAQALQEASGAPGGIAAGLLGQFDFLNPNVSTAGFSSVLGECYTGPRLDCKGVQVKVFGSDGEGTIAEPIIGALVGDAFAQQTGSLIGVKLTNPGDGYTVPPLVEVTDNCDNGYGAKARAVIDYDPQSPTYQQVTDIYVVTPGENYPAIDDSNQEYVVDHVLVIDSGENYSENDVITDNSGNVYTPILDDNGRIINVIPPNPTLNNVVPVKDIPFLTIESNTGIGANIKPQIAPRPTYQGEIKQVIDCISPRDGIVGFINGEPYYGPFHIHPDRGVKMVGAAHTTTPHAIIYDTPAESRTSSAGTGSVASTMSTVASPSANTYSPPEPTVSQPAETTTPSMDQNNNTTSSPPPSSPPPSSSPPSSPPPSSGGGGYGY